MASYNPWSKRPPTLPERTRTFELKSGESLTVTLRKLGTVQQTEVYELAEKYKERYVTGDSEWVDTGGKSGESAIPFPAMGGVQQQPTETMVQAAAMLYTMEVGTPEDCLTMEAWIAFQIVEDPSDWLAVQKFVREVGSIGKVDIPKVADVPNGSGAATKDCSESSCTDTSNTPSLRVG